MLSLTSSWDLPTEITCVNFGKKKDEEMFYVGGVFGDFYRRKSSGGFVLEKSTDNLATWFVSDSCFGSIDGSIMQTANPKDNLQQQTVLLHKLDPFKTRCFFDGEAVFVLDDESTLFKIPISASEDKDMLCTLQHVDTDAPLPHAVVTCVYGGAVLIATLGLNGVSVHKFDGAQSSQLFTLGPAQSPIRAIAFQAQTPLLAVADDFGLIRVCDAEHGSPLKCFSNALTHEQFTQVSVLAFSPTGDTRLAILSSNGNLRIWNWLRATLLHQFQFGPATSCATLRWNDSGDELLLGAGRTLYHFTVPPPKN